MNFRNAFYLFIAGLGVGVAISTAAFADLSIDAAVRAELTKIYPNAMIELNAPKLGEGLEITKSVRSAKLIDEKNGVAEVSVQLKDGTQKLGSIPFMAEVSTWVANRRIRPTEKLLKSDFSIQNIDVSSGLSREYRNLMLSSNANIEAFEARQTILEGQYPVKSGIEKIPDVRRGDQVRVLLISGGIQLSTPGISQEPAHLNENVRVLTGKTKKELVGKVLDNGTVEVRL